MASDFLLILVLILSLYTDLKHRRIYNFVTLPALVLGLMINSWNSGLSGLWFSCQGLLLGIALLFLPFILGGLGAGDVKLLGAVGAIKGPHFVFTAFLLTAISGGLIALVILAYNRKLVSTLFRLGRGLKAWLYSGFNLWSLEHLAEQAEDSVYFPYGLAIVLGSISAYWVM